ncbi:MAG: hypothetical protein KGV59_07595 [Tenacibaculum sp.]|nr:hypothetical protein [Tenacibaculum sp.]
MQLIEKPQIKRIQTAMSKRFTSRDERLDFISDFLQREVNSTKELSKVEADELLYFLNKGKTKNYEWGHFDAQNSQHRTILSLCRQAQWVVSHDKYGEVADLDRLSNFLKSPKCPVNKPLMKMTKQELSKVIVALEGIVEHIHS